MGDETNGALQPSPTDSKGLADIARTATPPEPGEKRGRGRPPGPASAKPGVAPVALVPAIPPRLWDIRNVGAIARLPFAGAAMFTGVKELALTIEEEPMIVPPLVDVLNEFAPMAATKWAGVICLSAGLMAVGSSKYAIYRKVMAERKKEQEEKAK